MGSLLGLMAIFVSTVPFVILAGNDPIAAESAVQVVGFSGLKPREADLVTIRAVLEDPQQYHLHRVRFEGKILKIDTLQNSNLCRRFDGYVFQFEDETGSIEVIDSCVTPESAPRLVAHPVQVGEPVSIIVTIIYSTHGPGSQIQVRLEWIQALQRSVP